MHARLGGHQEALVRISTFLAETRFAVSQSVRIWTLVFWLCLSFPLEAWVRGTGWETPWAGSWMHGPLPAQEGCVSSGDQERPWPWMGLVRPLPPGPFLTFPLQLPPPEALGLEAGTGQQGWAYL